MKFNTIFTCLILWLAVELIAMIAGGFRRINLKQEHIAKKRYMLRLLELTSENFQPEELLKELYYGFIKDKRLRVLLLHALKFPPEKAFKYIYSVLGCEPMRKIHAHLLKRIDYIGSKEEKIISKPLISKATKDYLINEINKWDESWSNQLKSLKRHKAFMLIEKTIIQVISIVLYLCLQTDLSYYMFIIVNTIGVIMFIILDYECLAEDGKIHEGNLASKKYAKKLSQSFARTVENTYQLVASLGIIINITAVVMNWLGPVA